MLLLMDRWHTRVDFLPIYPCNSNEYWKVWQNFMFYRYSFELHAVARKSTTTGEGFLLVMAMHTLLYVQGLFGMGRVHILMQGFSNLIPLQNIVNE